MDVLEGRPYRAPDSSLGLFGRYLELDLEKIEGVHAEDGYCAGPNASSCMVLL